ncbi:MAG: hypothetical protein R3195_02910 [Gemmatimonadota bacterium]|nr:hypothetical protein [Gemmatimonadota bacterium]
MRRWRVVVLAVSSMLCAREPLAGQSEACADAPRPVLAAPPIAAPDSAARGSEYWQWTHAFERATTGVGVLEPGSRPDGSPPGYDWLPDVSLPLFARPGDAEPAAWIHRGWWVVAGDRGADRPIGYRGMLETSYEQAGLVVTRSREDGWLEVWIDIGPVGRAATYGLMWTHSCLLALGETPLVLSLWEDRFVGDGAPPLSFLGEERHALRAGVGPDADVVVWLVADDEVELLEIDGDWARVRASRPGRYLTGCLGEEWDGEVIEGWVRWRSTGRGSWIWYPTRGC